MSKTGSNKKRQSASSRMVSTENRLLTKLDKKLYLNDVGGLKVKIDLLKSILLSTLGNNKQYEELGKYPPNGLLIYGLPGTGKTMVINAFINEYEKQLNFIKVDCKNLLSKNAQEPELKLKELIDQAIELAPKSILIFDDMEFIFPNKRKQLSETEKRLLLLIYELFDNQIEKRRIVIIGITNSLDDIDTKLRRSKRFDYEIEFNVPLLEERIEILDKILAKCEHQIKEEKLDEFARNLIAYTGSDIDLIVSFAAMNCVEAGRKHLQLDDLKEAANKVKPSAMREIKLEVPAVYWSDIGGMELVKTKLIECLVWPIKYKHIYDRFNEVQPKGVLMYGPPGCSKTMIGKALATECKHRFISIKGPEIFSKYVGESEKAVRDLFSKARQIAPSIIFFDEIDAIAVNRASDIKSANSVNDKVVSTLLNELDGIEKLSNVFVVATTNRPDIIDQSLLRTGRLDSIIYVPLPDFKTRKEIFRIKLSKIPYRLKSNENKDNSLIESLTYLKLDDKQNKQLNDELSILAERTKNYSGAEIITICHDAFVIALRNSLTMNKEELTHLTFDNYQDAISNSKPRTSEEMVRLHKEFAEKFCYFDLFKNETN